jgi:hypothetical protein
LQFQNSLVLDLLRECERCFVFDNRDVITWWIEIQLQEVVERLPFQ